MRTYTEEDVATAGRGSFPLVGTDLEVSMNTQGKDAVIRINKGGVQVFRALLKNAASDLDANTLMRFSTFAPDFIMTIGDTRDGVTRLARSLGLT